MDLSTEQITAIFGGLALLLTNLYTIYLQNKAKQVLQVVNKEIADTKTLVNGQHSIVLKQLSTVTQDLADVTQRKGDIIAAQNAKENVDTHEEATKLVAENKLIE